MKYLLLLSLVLTTQASANDGCNVEVGNYVWDRAVTVGAVTTFFNPRLLVDKKTKIVIAFHRDWGKSYSDAICLALGKESGTVGQLNETADVNKILAVFLDKTGSVDFIDELGSQSRYTDYYWRTVGTVSCR